MDLIAEIKRKNDQLLLQNTVLQQCWCARINTSKISSFLITFAIAPFIAGAVTQLVLGAKILMSHQLYRVALSGLRFWSQRSIGTKK
jgi:hypothetical protein